MSGRDVEPAEEGRTAATRPNAADLVDAIQQTAAAMNAMVHQIEGLEVAIDAEQQAHHEMTSDLESTRQLLDTFEAAVAEAKRQRERTEILTAQHAKRAGRLKADLTSGRDDLALVADAVVRGLQQIGRTAT